MIHRMNLLVSLLLLGSTCSGIMFNIWMVWLRPVLRLRIHISPKVIKSRKVEKVNTYTKMTKHLETKLTWLRITFLKEDIRYRKVGYTYFMLVYRSYVWLRVSKGMEFIRYCMDRMPCPTDPMITEVHSS